MSGAGKWVKKNPLQAVGLLAGAALLPQALPALFGGAGVAPALALGGAAEGGGGAFLGLSGLSELPAAESVGAGVLGGTAEGGGGAFGVAEAAGGGGPMSFIDKIGPKELLLANAGMGLLAPGQQAQAPVPMAQRPQMVAQGGGMGGLLPYGDPAEEEKWRRMQQSGRFYG